MLYHIPPFAPFLPIHKEPSRPAAPLSGSALSLPHSCPLSAVYPHTVSFPPLPDSDRYSGKHSPSAPFRLQGVQGGHPFPEHLYMHPCFPTTHNMQGCPPALVLQELFLHTGQSFFQV